jgi:AcrR family transcriptional regulator
MRALPGSASRTPTGRRPIARDQLAVDQRRRILRAVAELVAKRGYHGTSVELIVRKARVGYATFYKNFEDKEACFLAFLDTSTELVWDSVDEAVAAEQGPWSRKVAVMLHTLFARIAAEPVFARASLVEALTAGPASVARYERALQRMVPILRPGRELNAHESELPETLEETIAGGIVWIAYQRLIVGEADHLEALVPETLEFALAPYIGEDEAVRAASEIIAQTV